MRVSIALARQFLPNDRIDPVVPARWADLSGGSACVPAWPKDCEGINAVRMSCDGRSQKLSPSIAIAPVMTGQAVPPTTASPTPAAGDDAFGQMLQSAQDAAAGVETGPVQVMPPAGAARDAEDTGWHGPQRVLVDAVGTKPVSARKDSKAGAVEPGVAEGGPVTPVPVPIIMPEMAAVSAGVTPAVAPDATEAAGGAPGTKGPPELPVAVSEPGLVLNPPDPPPDPGVRPSPAAPAEAEAMQPVAGEASSADHEPAGLAQAVTTQADGAPALSGAGGPASGRAGFSEYRDRATAGAAGPAPEAEGPGRGPSHDVVAPARAAIASGTDRSRVTAVEAGPTRRDWDPVAGGAMASADADGAAPADAVPMQAAIPIEAAPALTAVVAPAKVASGSSLSPLAEATDEGPAARRSGQDAAPVQSASPVAPAVALAPPAAAPAQVVSEAVAQFSPAPQTRTRGVQIPEPPGGSAVPKVGPVNGPVTGPVEPQVTAPQREVAVPAAVGLDAAPQPAPAQAPAVAADTAPVPVHGTAGVPQPVAEPAARDAARTIAERKNGPNSVTDAAKPAVRTAGDPLPQAIGSPDVAPASLATTAVPAAAPDSASHAPTITAQIGPALVTLAKTVDGAQQMTVRLHPAELGMVQVRIERATSGLTQIDITADKPETLLALQRDQPALHRTLDQAGVPSAGRTISFQRSSTTRRHHPAEGPRRPARVGRPARRSSVTRMPARMLTAPPAAAAAVISRARPIGGDGTAGESADSEENVCRAPAVRRTYRAGLDITA